jgi:hypothetical protein
LAKNEIYDYRSAELLLVRPGRFFLALALAELDQVETPLTGKLRDRRDEGPRHRRQPRRRAYRWPRWCIQK